MKRRSLLITGSLSVVVTVCLAVTICVGQFGGANEDGRPSAYKGVLINDLPSRPPRDEQRFQIVTTGSRVLLLDSRTGNSWVLTANAKQAGKLVWLEIPRVRELEKDHEAAPAKPPRDFDPFK